ncbi:transmembrane protein 132D-like isoform X1 [Petromyzon marinus]|uniref:transmembrane protein 132D-like isoform X1 n=1 Tax=Petromyzon marinus TaxID=7757 RepID=UPI003F6F58EB
MLRSSKTVAAWDNSGIVGLLLLLATLKGEMAIGTVTSSVDNSLRTPLWLPLQYNVLNTETFFFLKNLKKDVVKYNSSMQTQSQHLLIFGDTKAEPIVNVSYGPFSAWKTLHEDQLGPKTVFPSTSATKRVNWHVQALVAEEYIYSNNAKVQVLFYISRKEWDNQAETDTLPCVRLYAFHETQEVRTSCQLKGDLGMCLAEVVLPSIWFEPLLYADDLKQEDRLSNSTTVELYYNLQPVGGGDCSPNVHQKMTIIRPFKTVSKKNLSPVGTVYLQHAPEAPKLHEINLDENVVIYLPTKPLRPEEVIDVPVKLMENSAVQHFTLRFSMIAMVSGTGTLVNKDTTSKLTSRSSGDREMPLIVDTRFKAKKGISVLSIHPSNPMVWDVMSDINRGAKHTFATIEVVKKRGTVSIAKKSEIAQLVFEMENITSQTVTRRILWHVGSSAPGLPLEAQPGQVTTEITITQLNLTTIIPFPKFPELVNTAVLTGQLVRMPLQVVAIDTSGILLDVSQRAHCQSADEDVLKVTESCDYVYVDGRESAGSTRAHIQVTHEHLRAGLELAVWLPRLPLHIQLSHSQLGQVKGWRVPIFSESRLQGTGSVAEDEDGKARGCTLQSQHATLKVWTHFIASNDVGQVTSMLGSDWLVDVTFLVKDHVTVRNPAIARVRHGTIVVAQQPGRTFVQVVSPVSSAVLGEEAVRVGEDKVTISRLHVMLVSGISLSLQPSLYQANIVSAFTYTQHVLHTPKQEAAFAIWIQFSDGTMVPLDVFNSEEYILLLRSLDDRVVSVTHDQHFMWSKVIAEGEGQGGFLKAEFMISEACQKTNRKTTLVSPVVNVRVRFGNDSEDLYDSRDDYIIGDDSLERLTKVPQTAVPWMEKESVSKSVVTFTRPTQSQRETWKKGLEVVNVAPSSEDERPISRSSGENDDDSKDEDFDQDGGDDMASVENDGIDNKVEPGLSDVQIGMYTLLGVFCLAIVVFHINCIFFALKRRCKEAPQTQDEIDPTKEWTCMRTSREHVRAQKDNVSSASCHLETCNESSHEYEHIDHNGLWTIDVSQMYSHSRRQQHVPQRLPPPRSGISRHCSFRDKDIEMCEFRK